MHPCPSRTLAAAALILVASIATACSRPPSTISPDEAAVRATVREALEASRALALAASKLAPGVEASRLEQDASRQFADLYTGAALARKVQTVQMDLAEAHPGNDDQSGIKKISFDDVRIGADTATVKTTVESWDSWTEKGDWTADYTFDLVRRDGRWLIEKEAVTYPPGQAPG
jgi:hypothetical protein